MFGLVVCVEFPVAPPRLLQAMFLTVDKGAPLEDHALAVPLGCDAMQLAASMLGAIATRSVGPKAVGGGALCVTSAAAVQQGGALCDDNVIESCVSATGGLLPAGAACARRRCASRTQLKAFFLHAINEVDCSEHPSC